MYLCLALILSGEEEEARGGRDRRAPQHREEEEKEEEEKWGCSRVTTSCRKWPRLILPPPKSQTQPLNLISSYATWSLLIQRRACSMSHIAEYQTSSYFKWGWSCKVTVATAIFLNASRCVCKLLLRNIGSLAACSDSFLCCEDRRSMIHDLMHEYCQYQKVYGIACILQTSSMWS